MGKTHVLRWAHEKRYFDASRYVFIDPDRIRYEGVWEGCATRRGVCVGGSASKLSPRPNPTPQHPPRYKLPECGGYMLKDRSTMGSMTQMESGYIAEILQSQALANCKNVVVDGSLRNWGWYRTVFEGLRREQPEYKIAILSVECERETMHTRAARRGEQTGRVVPVELLDEVCCQPKVKCNATGNQPTVRVYRLSLNRHTQHAQAKHGS